MKIYFKGTFGRHRISFLKCASGTPDDNIFKGEPQNMKPQEEFP